MMHLLLVAIFLVAACDKVEIVAVPDGGSFIGCPRCTAEHRRHTIELCPVGFFDPQGEEYNSFVDEQGEFHWHRSKQVQFCHRCNHGHEWRTVRSDGCSSCDWRPKP